ncbi:ATP-binding protein [Saccharicrinis sp. 156]|uniref:ATP-binding protein n=1 Tax=Saccharicrinis sp. 156 TaxID=3417574 RepID=UPI003D346110
MNIPKNIISREDYISKIDPFINTSLIKVLTGQRRVGKSYLLFQLINLISKRYDNANIIYINLEDLAFDFIKTAKDLNNYVIEHLSSSNPNYLFVDEIQDVEDFEAALRSLALNENIDIYITGSNAKMLSGELATTLSGRYIEISVYSLSYLEFLKFHSLDDSDDSLALFMKYGGLPYITNLPLNDDVIFEYLKNIYSTIIYRDVVSRFNLRNTQFLERLVIFLADNVGSLFSAKKISDFLKSQKVNISSVQIQNYIKYLSSAFIILPARRYDIVGKRIFEIGDKYFFENIGIRNAIVGYKTNDIAKILENLVYNHLLFCGYSVKVGVLNAQVIDFVCERSNNKKYVQVSYLLEKEETVKREFGNLLKIDDNHPKVVVSMDKLAGDGYDGVDHIYIRDFLRTRF